MPRLRIWVGPKSVRKRKTKWSYKVARVTEIVLTADWVSAIMCKTALNYYADKALIFEKQ